MLLRHVGVKVFVFPTTFPSILNTNTVTNNHKKDVTAMLPTMCPSLCLHAGNYRCWFVYCKVQPVCFHAVTLLPGPTKPRDTEN